MFIKINGKKGDKPKKIKIIWCKKIYTKTKVSWHMWVCDDWV